MYLSELTLIGRLGRPEVHDSALARNPTEHSFGFPRVGLSGRFDTSSGRVVGARLVVLPKLVTAAWGEDRWFRETFLEMVPAPDVRDLRGAPDPLAHVLGTGVEAFSVGDPEIVFRLAYRPLLQAAGLLRRPLG